MFKHFPVSFGRWGRRIPIVVFHMMAGIFLLLAEFVPGHGTTLQPLQVTFTMLGKFGITASYGVALLYAPELFPTTVRSVNRNNLNFVFIIY